MGFGKLQGTFEGAADVIGAGSHSEVVGDGIETIDKRFWKPNKDGTSFWFHDDGKYLGTQNKKMKDELRPGFKCVLELHWNRVAGSS